MKLSSAGVLQWIVSSQVRLTPREGISSMHLVLVGAPWESRLYQHIGGREGCAMELLPLLG